MGVGLDQGRRRPNHLSLTIGVPERTQRLSAVSMHTAIAIFVLGFLIL